MKGDYLIVSKASEDYSTSNGKEGAVKFSVEKILRNDQIKNLKKKKAWFDQIIQFFNLNLEFINSRPLGFSEPSTKSDAITKNIYHSSRFYVFTFALYIISG